MLPFLLLPDMPYTAICLVLYSRQYSFYRYDTPYFANGDQGGLVRRKQDFCLIFFSEASLSCRLLKLEATILMRFSSVRQVGLFFGAAYSTAECSWQACGISARHCLASTFGGHTRSSPIILLLLGYSRSALSNLHSRTDAVLFTNLALLFSSIVSQLLWVVLSYIFPLQS